MSTIVGIDLGTTNSLCSVFLDGRPQLVPNAFGDFLTPSIVGLLDSDEVVVGAAAAELRITKPERCSWCFKRHMGSGWEVNLAGKDYSSIDLSSLVLKSLADDASKFLDEPVSDAVITVPAYFNDHQRKATRMAGKLAGLKVRRIINEPTAAALVYGFHDREAEKTVAVIDLGGGTFDVTVMEIYEGTLEIVATAGESQLGGEDFTDRLVSAALKQMNMMLETAELRSPLLVARLRKQCEAAKKELAENGMARIRIPDTEGNFDESSQTLKISEEVFAKLSKPLMERIARPIDKAMRDSEHDKPDIDDVILVGGATRMQVMQNHVQNYFGRDALIEFNPDEVVALGAAVQAALIDNDAAVDDMVMTDICPFTLGVEVAKEFGHQQIGGYFSPIIHRNTTIPVSKEEMYSTVVTNQEEVLLRIFQGESRKTEGNLEFGQLAITNLPPGPAGMPIHVRFTYDLNGIIEVEAFVPNADRKFTTVLTNHVKGLDEDEIEEALERMQQLKFYPREDLRNQKLILFAEQAVGEVSPYQREELEEAIDFFEHAMSSGDREVFERHRTGLLMVLSQLGFHYEESEAEDDG